MEKNVINGNLFNVGTVNLGDNIYPPAIILPKELTQRIPRTNVDEIVGRQTDLEELYRLLNENKRVVLVNGLGGIGKTTLAQAYLTHYYEEYTHIAWITQTTQSFESAVVNDSTILKNLNVETGKATLEDIVLETFRKLKAIPEKPNLLVIDNADQSFKHYIDKIPSQPNWHILLTSREKISNLHVKEIGFLSEDDASTLFRRHYSLPNLNDQDVKELVGLVDCHTLTIELLAKTAQAQRYDISKLKLAIEEDIRANIDLPHNNNAKIDNIGSYLTSIFKLSNLDSLEIWLLKQFICLPSEYHSYTKLQYLLGDENSELHFHLSETINKIADKGWLLYNKSLDSYKMHVVISSIISLQISIYIDDIENLIKRINQNLFFDNNIDDPTNKSEWIHFGEKILTKFINTETFEIAYLNKNLSILFMELGKYEIALHHIEKAIEILEKIDKYNSEILLECKSNLALIYLSKGRYLESCDLLKYVLENDRNNCSDDNLKIVTRSMNLAEAKRHLGNFPEAKNLVYKSLPILEKKLGIFHQATARAYSNLALVLLEIGDYKKARWFLLRAMVSDKRNLPDSHKIRLLRYSNYAIILQYFGELHKAKKLLEEVVDIKEKKFGFDHLLTALEYSNLGTIVRQLGDNESSYELFKNALEIEKKELGVSHPETLVTYCNFALALIDKGDNKGAKNAYIEIIKYTENNDKIKDIAKARRYVNFSVLQFRCGLKAEAIQYMRKASLIYMSEISSGRIIPTNHDYLYAQQVWQEITS